MSDNHERDREIAEAARQVLASHQMFRPTTAPNTFTVTVGFDEWLRFERACAAATGGDRG